MNFCAALYTLSFLYIFVWLRLHCKKQRSEPSTPVSLSVPLPVFLCFLSSSTFIYFLPLSSLLLLFYVSQCPLLCVSYSPRTFIPFVLSLISHLSFNSFWVIVPGVREESHVVSANATRFFTAYKEVIWIFAATNFLVELVWIWSQNESYHFDVMEGREVWRSTSIGPCCTLRPWTVTFTFPTLPLLRMRQVPISNLDRETSYTDTFIVVILSHSWKKSGAEVNIVALLVSIAV